MQAGFPGIQKARRRTDFWPAKWRAGALLALIPALIPSLTGAVVPAYALTVVSWDSGAGAPHAGVEMPGGFRGM